MGIIELQNESWPRIVVADSLQDLLKQQIAVANTEGSDYLKFVIENGSI